MVPSQGHRVHRGPQEGFLEELVCRLWASDVRCVSWGRVQLGWGVMASL